MINIAFGSLVLHVTANYFWHIFGLFSFVCLLIAALKPPMLLRFLLTMLGIHLAIVALVPTFPKIIRGFYQLFGVKAMAIHYEEFIGNLLLLIVAVLIITIVVKFIIFGNKTKLRQDKEVGYEEWKKAT